MKLAEGLITRAALQKDISSLESRINKNLIVQEGQRAQEDAGALVEEFISMQRALTELITAIQRANATNYLLDKDDRPTGETLQDALIRRDGLVNLADRLRGFAGEAVPNMRYSVNEIKLNSTVDSVQLLKSANLYAKEARDLDILIQKTNWQVDL